MPHRGRCHTFRALPDCESAVMAATAHPLAGQSCTEPPRPQTTRALHVEMSFLQSPTHELIIAAVAGGALATAAIYLLAGGPKKAHPALTAAPTDYTDFNEGTATALAVARLRGCKASCAPSWAARR